MPELPSHVNDELHLLETLASLSRASIVEVGCGSADFARKLVAAHPLATVNAVEVDPRQHALNIGRPAPGITFAWGSGEDLPLPSAAFDLGLMLKSLHHVPGPVMDQALQEMARVLRPAGILYVSEPVFDGPFNEVVRLFHDEELVRAQAQAALDRAIASRAWTQVVDHRFMTPLHFRDFTEFERKIIGATYQNHALAPDLRERVQRRFEAHMGPEGARFVRPMRVRVLHNLVRH